MAGKLPLHGRDHRPPKYGVTTGGGGGGDPVQGMLYLPSDSETDGQVLTRDSTATHGIKWATSSGGGTYRNTDSKYSIMGPEWKTSQIWGTGYTTTVDPTANFGGYIEITSQNGYFVIGAPLGPQYSVWTVCMAYHRSTDGGQLTFDWQTTLVDGVFTGYGYGSGPFAESVEGPETNNSTYYKDNSATTVHQDFYSATPDDLYGLTYSTIRIGGADDTMLSAHGSALSADPYTSAMTVRDMNGGGNGNVMWWLRAKVPSKNASSSGYHARIYYLAIRRMESTSGNHII